MCCHESSQSFIFIGKDFINGRSRKYREVLYNQTHEQVCTGSIDPLFILGTAMGEVILAEVFS